MQRPLSEKFGEIVRLVLGEGDVTTAKVLLENMSKKYFKIRIYHRAFVVMESYKSRKVAEKRTKALRKELKRKDSQHN